jgi:hypothetical protein
MIDFRPIFDWILDGGWLYLLIGWPIGWIGLVALAAWASDR